MIKYTEILKVVNNKLKKHFPDIPILAEGDIKEKIIRPAFMTKLDNIGSSLFNTDIRDRSLTIIIYYFPSDRYKNKVELYSVMSELDDLFYYDSFLRLSEEYIIPIYSDISSEITDGVLNYSFEIEFSEEIIKDYSNKENMENLEIKEV